MARYLIDTNVLLRAAAPESSHHVLAVNAIATLLARGEELVLAPQVLVELWSVATRPIDVNGCGWAIEDAEAEIARLIEQFPLLPETPAILPEWFRLVVAHRVVGKKAHDARLVTIMKINGIDSLLTFNVNDFKVYGLNVVSPEEVLPK